MCGVVNSKASYSLLLSMMPKMFLVVFGLLSSVLAAAEAPNYVPSTLGTSTTWVGTRWTSDDTALFGGMPSYSGPDRHIILVRYAFYVSAYNVDKLSPLWVAHVNEQDSEMKAGLRIDSTWDRGSDVFK